MRIHTRSMPSKRKFTKTDFTESESDTSSDSGSETFDETGSESTEYDNDTSSSGSESNTSESEDQLENIKSVSKKKYGKDIREIIIEPINDDFSWGKYADFEVVIMNKNGFINCTKMCQHISDETGHQRLLKNWTPITNAKELIKAVSSTAGQQATDLMPIIKGGKIQEITGTYCHPDLVPHIASWASPQFAVKVARIVNEYLSREAKDEREKLLRKKDDKIDKLNHKINKVLEGNQTLQKGNQNLQKDNKDLKSRMKVLMANSEQLIGTANNMDRKMTTMDKTIHTIANDRVVHTGKQADASVLYIIKNNNRKKNKRKNKKTVHAYSVIRTARRSLNAALATHEAKNPRMKIIKKIKYSPNSINLWTRIKNKLQKTDKINGNGCGFNLCEGFSERKLLKYIEKIHDERLDTETI